MKKIQTFFAAFLMIVACENAFATVFADHTGLIADPSYQQAIEQLRKQYPNVNSIELVVTVTPSNVGSGTVTNYYGLLDTLTVQKINGRNYNDGQALHWLAYENGGSAMGHPIKFIYQIKDATNNQAITPQCVGYSTPYTIDDLQNYAYVFHLSASGCTLNKDSV